MSKIEDLKKEYNYKTSEELFDIGEPSEYQCSKIDSLIKNVCEIEKLSNYKYEDEEELKIRLDDINWYIRYFEDELEDIRSAIEKIKDWGQEWKHRAKEMVEKHDIEIEELQ